MHSVPDLGTNVPAFLAKLWKLVDDPETDDLICWSPNGRSFFIRNQAQFARELLPHYYKHNNMASFVRQLNMYGFHKKVSVELGGLKCDRDEMEFAHQFFTKGHPYLIDHIKRKIASSKGLDPTLAPIKSELMNKMLTEVRNMRGRQETLDSRLGAMKRENEALWRELAVLRQKHMKQQQIVNKLIHFLVTLVQPSRNSGLSVKRRYPLMIDDFNRQRKQAKLSKPQSSPVGPVIHELDAEEPDIDSEFIVAEMLEGHTSPTIESPKHSNTLIMEDNNMETVHLVDDSMQLQNEVQLIASQGVEAKKKRGYKGKKKEEVGTHLETMETDLENIYEILNSQGCSIDANKLLSSLQLFEEDPLLFGMSVNPELNSHSEKEEDDRNNGGGELMAYNPTQTVMDFDNELNDELNDFEIRASSINNTDDGTTSSLYNSDPLDLEDNKVSFFESLTNNINNTS